MIPLLVSRTDAIAKLQISLAVTDAEFNKLMEETQMCDLAPELPEAFFSDLLKNKNNATWKKIIDGGSYEYTPTGATSPQTYYYQGIGHALTYFWYARYVMTANAVSTAHGLVTKATPQSNPVPLEERKNIHYLKRQEAFVFLNDTIKFIIRNKSDYPSWKYYYNNDYINGDPLSANCPIGWNPDYPMGHEMNKNITMRNRGASSGSGSTTLLQ